MTTRTQPETAARSAVLTDPAYQAFLLLRTALALARLATLLPATYAHKFAHRPAA
jgi:hypothetical protein